MWLGEAGCDLHSQDWKRSVLSPHIYSGSAPGLGGFHIAWTSGNAKNTPEDWETPVSVWGRKLTLLHTCCIHCMICFGFQFEEQILGQWTEVRNYFCKKLKSQSDLFKVTAHKKAPPQSHVAELFCMCSGAHKTCLEDAWLHTPWARRCSTVDLLGGRKWEVMLPEEEFQSTLTPGRF